MNLQEGFQLLHFPISAGITGSNVVEVFAVTKALEISSTSMLTKQVNWNHWIVGADSANVIRWLGKVYTLKAAKVTELA
jgi:hypothetical protein